MSELIFEEESDDVGADIEAYCPKCKGDTSHTIITKYEDEIRRVQCSPCGDVHSYRKPRGEEQDEVPEPVSAKKRAIAKKPTWKEAIDKVGNKINNLQRPYSIRDTYDEGDWLTHPKFGVGIVTEIMELRVEVTFEDERRVLVHNRPDLAAQMPAIASIPAPREAKGRKGKRGKGKMLPMGKKPDAAVSAPAFMGGKSKVGQSVPVAAGKAVAAKPVVGKPMLGKPALAKAAPAKQVLGKVERAKAAAAKKGAAKGKSAPAKKPAKSKPAAKAKPAAARRASRPGARAGHQTKASKKLKAGSKKR